MRLQLFAVETVEFTLKSNRPNNSSAPAVQIHSQLKCHIVYVRLCMYGGFDSYFRWRSGVASTLNYIDIDSKETSPILMPYPNWQANSLDSDGFSTAETMGGGGRTNAPMATVVDGQLADNSSIISTFRIRVDECDRLWIMDTGLADILGNPKQIAPPALVIFDLNTNKLIKRYTIPDAYIKDDTFFANVVCTFNNSMVFSA